MAKAQWVVFPLLYKVQVGGPAETRTVMTRSKHLQRYVHTDCSCRFLPRDRAPFKDGGWNDEVFHALHARRGVRGNLPAVDPVWSFSFDQGSQVVSDCGLRGCYTRNRTVQLQRGFRVPGVWHRRASRGNATSSTTDAADEQVNDFSQVHHRSGTSLLLLLPSFHRPRSTEHVDANHPQGTRSLDHLPHPAAVHVTLYLGHAGMNEWPPVALIGNPPGSSWARTIYHVTEDS